VQRQDAIDREPQPLDVVDQVDVVRIGLAGGGVFGGGGVKASASISSFSRGR
jgi:hypothetical protein